MSYLLDTHIWVWMHLEPQRLNPAVIAALEAVPESLWLSPISIWEILLLTQRGRLDLGRGVLSWIALALTKMPLREAAITLDVAREMYGLELPHRDPADQFLVATAQVYGLTLVTADERLLRVKGINVFPNR